MRDTGIKLKQKRIIWALILSVLLVFNTKQIANADIFEPQPYNVLMVGVKAQELASTERGILTGKRVIEIPRTSDWQKSIEGYKATEVIVRQNTGFVGLYTPSGILLKSIFMADGSNPANQSSASPIQTVTYQEEQDFGYRVGGRIDPYKPINVYEPKNNARLSAGWGYNSTQGSPESRRGVLTRFLDLSPIDTVTPLNYPGFFDQRSLPFAYGMGVIPHIGALTAAKMRAKEDNDYYNEMKLSSGMPNYTEQPVTYYRNSRAEPTNPIVQDPNFLRMSPMPDAFQQQYPGYGNNFMQQGDYESQQQQQYPPQSQYMPPTNQMNYAEPQAQTTGLNELSGIMGQTDLGTINPMQAVNTLNQTGLGAALQQANQATNNFNPSANIPNLGNIPSIPGLNRSMPNIPGLNANLPTLPQMNSGVPSMNYIPGLPRMGNSPPNISYPNTGTTTVPGGNIGSILKPPGTSLGGALRRFF